MLSFQQKDVMEALVQFLDPFNFLTDLLSGEKAATVSSVLPLVTHIKQLRDTTSNAEEDGPSQEDGNQVVKLMISDLKKAIWLYISTRYLDLSFCSRPRKCCL